MRVLIAGAGRAAIGVAVHLARAKHDVTVIEIDPVRVKQVQERHGLVALVGDATEPVTLLDAEVGTMDVALAMLLRDADNLAFALLAREAGLSRVWVRMRDPNYRGVFAAAGVQRLVSETDVYVGALATAIEHDAVRHAMLLSGGESIAMELVVTADAWIAGRTVSEIAADPGFPISCVFAGVVDANAVFTAPRGNTVIEPGTTVLVVTRTADLQRVIHFAIGKRK